MSLFPTYLTLLQPLLTFGSSLSYSGGSVNAIQDIRTSASPLWARQYLTQTNQIYTVGDSLTARGYYQSKLTQLRGAAWHAVNRGVGGNRTDQMIARFANEVAYPGDARVIIVFAGINDVLQGVAEATIKTNLQSLYTAAAATGADVVAVKMTPFKGYSGWTSGKQTIVDNVNTWISSTATDIDFIIDAYSLMEDPGSADYLLAAYDDGDGLHFNQTGGDALGIAINSGVTWSAGAATSAWRMTGVDVIANQDLLTSSQVRFKALTLDVGTVDGPSFVVRPGILALGLVAGAIENDGSRLYFTTSVPGRATIGLTSDYDAGVYSFVAGGYVRALPSNSVPFTGKGAEFTYNLSADEARFSSFDRDSSTWKPFVISAGGITINNALGGSVGIYGTSWVNVYWGAGVLVSDSGGSVGPTNSVSITGAYTSGAPSGGSAGAWKFGTYSATAPTPTGKVRIDIGGTAYLIPAELV